jgi:hypothetical protein
MSRAPTAPVPVSRPSFVDYFLILAGVALSLFLADFSGLQVRPKPAAPPNVERFLLPLLPRLLYLPLGVILLWPCFYCTQWVLGRKQGLTFGEWLWGIAWLGSLALLGWHAWLTWGEPPGFLNDPAYRPPIVWFFAVVPVMALLALFLWLVDLIARWRQPWTHTFSLVLALWPLAPLGAVLPWGRLAWERISL